MIPENWSALWAAIYGALGVFGAIVIWLVGLERRLNARLTRDEHTKICDKANLEMTKKLDNIQRLIEQQGKETISHRQWVGENIGSIRTQVAIIKDRMRDDPLPSDTLLTRSAGEKS